MSPADRAALAARLRHHEESSWPNLPAWTRADLLAAAELERPRPRVEWRAWKSSALCTDAVEASIVGTPILWSVRADHAEAFREQLLAAGFDVDEVPRG